MSKRILLSSSCISFTLLAALLVAGSPSLAGEEGHAPAAAAASPNPAGAIVGGQVTLAEATKIEDILADPDRYNGQVVLLEGQVTGVCQASGCWVSLKTTTEEPLYCMSMDHSISFPRDCTGRTALVQGKVIVEGLPKEAEGAAAAAEGVVAAKAEETHTHAEGEAPHTCPKPTIKVSIEGARLK